MADLMLDKKDRLIISYLLKILEKLYPAEQDYYARHREAIEEGFELHYDWITENLSDGLTSDQCSFVLDVFDLYTAIRRSFEKLENTDIKIENIKFQGFDGNHEIEYLSYTRYFLDNLSRYDEIRKDANGYYNSHRKTIPQYKMMLEKWNRLGKSHDLSEVEIKEILDLNSQAK